MENQAEIKKLLLGTIFPYWDRPTYQSRPTRFPSAMKGLRPPGIGAMASLQSALRAAEVHEPITIASKIIGTRRPRRCVGARVIVGTMRQKGYAQHNSVSFEMCCQGRRDRGSARRNPLRGQKRANYHRRHLGMSHRVGELGEQDGYSPKAWTKQPTAIAQGGLVLYFCGWWKSWNAARRRGARLLHCVVSRWHDGWLAAALHARCHTRRYEE